MTTLELVLNMLPLPHDNTEIFEGICRKDLTNGNKCVTIWLHFQISAILGRRAMLIEKFSLYL